MQNQQDLTQLVRTALAGILAEVQPSNSPAQQVTVAPGGPSVQITVRPTGDVVIQVQPSAATGETVAPCYLVSPCYSLSTFRCYGFQCYGPELEQALGSVLFSTEEEGLVASILQATCMSRSQLLS